MSIDTNLQFKEKFVTDSCIKDSEQEHRVSSMRVQQKSPGKNKLCLRLILALSVEVVNKRVE